MDRLEMSEYVLKKGIVVTPGKKPRAGSIGVSGKKIASVKFGDNAESAAGGTVIDLKGASFVYPSLVNSHDHLQGNYRPPIGPKEGTFYLNWQPWDNDLKSSATFAERSKLVREELYLLSSYKCIFSGVTTVNDHFPHTINSKILPTLPIRAIQEYTLAHEATSYDLKWGDGVPEEHARAVEKNWPFITHLCEGFDEESMHSVGALEKMGILDNHCLFVHCIGFSDEDIKKAAKAGASISLCPSSNLRMFNVTAKMRKMIKSGMNLAIGTDSSASGPANLLEEMRVIRRVYQEMYREDLSPEKIFHMVTINGAKAFRMQDRIGSIEEGKLGDLMVVKARKNDPYENLVSTTMEDIQLLVLEGNPIYGERRFLDIFTAAGGKQEIPAGYTEITVGKKPMFVIGDPAALYKEIRSRTGFKKILDFLPFDPAPAATAEKPAKEST